MVAKKTRGKLLLLLLVIAIITTAIFVFLVRYNEQITKETASEISAMYMSEMMYQTQDHFETIVKLKNQDAISAAQQTLHSSTSDFRGELIENAELMGFDYLALSDDNGNYETIMGETAWYRNLPEFIEEIKNGEVTSTTGYLVKSGEKYLVFGVPVNWEMEEGSLASVLLLGFNVEKLYDYIDIENMEQFGHDIRMDIILTNGSYVLNHGKKEDLSYFEHILQYGDFVGIETREGIVQIEKAMADGKSFSHTVILDGSAKHIYGAPAYTTQDWYFILSMPQGATDTLLNRQNDVKLIGFGIAGVCIFLLFFVVFLIYLRMSYKQIKETEDAKKEAEIANSAKSDFLSNMSHDIRTPMNAVAGFAVIAEESMKQGKVVEALEAISKMRHSTDYLRNLIGDVLDMSKIESGKLTLMPEIVSLTQITEIIDTIARVHTEAKNQSYKYFIHDIIHDCVECDQTRLRQVLVNLIGNAVKFTAIEGEVTFEVWQERSGKGNDFVRTYFQVRDNGIGMSEEFMDSIFDSFSREENRVRKIEGTGLGLAISKRLVDMMEGKITVESKEGEGSCFCVTIDFPKAKTMINKDVLLTDSIENMHVIMAEDNEFNFEIAQVLLEGYGVTVYRAANGEEAVKLYCEAPDKFDLILMDLRMPIMDGYQATERIRAFEAEQSEFIHIPIFALTADVFEEDIKKCTKMGMEGHISKPIDMSELLHKVSKYLKASIS